MITFILGLLIGGGGVNSSYTIDRTCSLCLTNIQPNRKYVLYADPDYVDTVQVIIESHCVLGDSVGQGLWVVQSRRCNHDTISIPIKGVK